MARSFLKETDFSLEEAREVFELANRYKNVRGAGRLDVISAQPWGLLFFKKSTRTRLSFEAGVYELGGHPLILNAGDLQLSRGETVEDTAKIMGRYLKGVVIRAYEHSVVESFREHSGIPVINALTDFLHPCQSYTDIFSMMEHFGGGIPTLEAVRGKKFVFFGDTSCNMAYSLALAGCMFGLDVTLCGPEGFEPKEDLDRLFAESGIEKSFKFTSDAAAAAKGADVLYTDVWVSMGMEEQRERRLKLMAPYQVNESLFAKASGGAIFMHCLPAHAGEEVSEGVLRGAQSIIFDEAENRLHVQKAIISRLVRSK